MGREESFHNIPSVPEQDEGDEADHEPDFKRKSKVRATTGDLAKFLRNEQQEHAGKSGQDLSSPHGTLPYLHTEHPMLSNTASLYSLMTDVTGVTGALQDCCSSNSFNMLEVCVSARRIRCSSGRCFGSPH